MKKLILASVISVTSFSVLAADSVDISVVGTITSAACVPTASGGGVVDYGNIKPDSLAKSGPTILSVKTIGFTVNCDAPANVALRAYSNRAGTTTDAGPENTSGSALASSSLITAGLGQDMPYGQQTMTDPTVAGLGLGNGVNIGGYMLNLPPVLVTLDGVDATSKYYTYAVPTSTTSWKKEDATKASNNGHSLFSNNTAYFSYSTDSSLASPSPFTELAGTLLIQGYITDKANLDLSSPINLDGSSTIELYYF